MDIVGDLDIDGLAFCTNSVWSSDASLKENIADTEGSLAIVNALQPRTYTFRQGDDVGMWLPTGLQRGVIAQELEEVLPDLVIERTISARLDSTGAVVVPERTLKSVNYIGLIPVLIGAVQEQQAQVAAEQASNAALTDRLAEQDARIAAQDEVLNSMREELAQMREALAACCAATPGDTRLFTTPPANTPDDLNKALEGDARHLHIQPNPFAERTTLHYRLERAGRMQLLANSADGKALKVLQDATLEAGTYQFNWETNELTPGVYYVTLLLDGEPLLKKAVKVMR